MSLEVWSTVASLGTFVVITATAIAALVQLRHARSANQIAAVTEIRETLESEKFTRARRFVAEEGPKLIADPEGRRKLAGEILPPEIRDVGNFFEVMGAFVKFGIIDQALVRDLWDGLVYTTWKQLEPVAMMRRQRFRGTWASFEYLAVICEKSLARTG